VLNQNFCLDKTTGFLNLFGLIKAVTTEKLGDHGCVVFFYGENSSPFPSNYSLEGAKIFRSTFDTYIQTWQAGDQERRIIPARISNQDFVLIYPGRTRAEAEELASQLKAKISTNLEKAGFDGHIYHDYIMSYGEEGKDPTAFLRLLFLSQINSTHGEEEGEFVSSIKSLIVNLSEHIYQSYGLLSQAHSLALSDDISGLPNHRAAESILEEKLNKSIEAQEPFSILFIDGDNLKQYNHLSYQRGNLMIRHLAELLAGQLRKNDFLARWFSGDEFLAVLPGADRQEAFRIGERLRSVVETATKHWPIPVTISIGMASYPEDGSSMEELLRKAEEANFLAKSRGKNQVCEAKGAFDRLTSALPRRQMS